jgi:hypothetical protein
MGGQDRCRPEDRKYRVLLATALTQTYPAARSDCRKWKGPPPQSLGFAFAMLVGLTSLSFHAVRKPDRNSSNVGEVGFAYPRCRRAATGPHDLLQQTNWVQRIPLIQCAKI